MGDLVLLDSFLEYYPSQTFDAAVLCNVLEPYTEDMRQLVFQHSFEFINPGGQVIVVVACGTKSESCVTSEGGLGISSDLIFPSSKTAVRPDEIEDGLILAGFDIA